MVKLVSWSMAHREEAWRFAFASSGLAGRVQVRALNDPEPERWGPSDHCRVEIEVA